MILLDQGDLAVALLKHPLPGQEPLFNGGGGAARDEDRPISLAGGAYRVSRGRSAGRAEERMDSTGNTAEMRLNAELTALHGERQRLITEAARAKAAKKSSGWW